MSVYSVLLMIIGAKRDAPESCAWAAISSEVNLFGDENGVSIMKTDFCFVVDCSVSGIRKFTTAEKGLVEG